MVNSLFFTDEQCIKYNLPKIIYSTLISTVINLLIKTLALSQDSILAIKKENNLRNAELRKEISKLKKKLTIKFILFFL